MIKLQDFAKQQGVTDRAIQKHLKTYASELEGLYERKGPNGTWLTDEACELLRSKMRQMPMTIMDVAAVDQELREKLDEKQSKIEKLQDALLDAKDRIDVLKDEKRQLELENAKIPLLSADNEEKDKSIDELETKLKNASEELTAIKGKWWYKLFAGKSKE